MTEEEARELNTGDEVIIRGTFIQRFKGDMVIKVKSFDLSGRIIELPTITIPDVVSLPTADRKEAANG